MATQTQVRSPRRAYVKALGDGSMPERAVLVVDDRRSAGFPHVVARSVDEAFVYLRGVGRHGVDELWLDYDLGTDRFGVQQTTWDIVLALTDADSELFSLPIAQVFVHTADGRAGERIRRRLTTAGYVVHLRPLPQTSRPHRKAPRDVHPTQQG